MISIVTDSTADLSPSTLALHPSLRVVPLSITFGSEIYEDDTTIERLSFYQRLVQSKQIPQTSQPSPQKFLKAYQRAVAAGATAILSMHISAALSGTYRSAHVARDLLQIDHPHIPVEIVDSRTLTYGLGLGVLAAARAAQAGASLDACRQQATQIFAKSHLLFTVNNLHYLEQGGRIGKAASMWGSLLRIFPLLSLRDGAVTGLERVRGRERVAERMVAQTLARIPAGSSVTGAFLYSGGVTDEIDKYRTAVQEQYVLQDMQEVILTPCIVAHVGPAAWGAVLLPLDK